MSRSLKGLFVSVLFLFSTPLFAKDVPAQARVFLGATSVSLDTLNTELESQGFKKVENMPFYGAEVLYPFAYFLEVGLRYSYRNLEENNSVGSTENFAKFEQHAVSAVARVPFIKLGFLRADAYASFGGSNTTFAMKTATVDGELNKKDEGSWLASTYMSYGASVGVGYNKFFFFLEGGYESNLIDSFKRVGNINSSITELDLSGPYFMIGLMFDGASVSKK